jgi:hypothetical protein
MKFVEMQIVLNELEDYAKKTENLSVMLGLVTMNGGGWQESMATMMPDGGVPAYTPTFKRSG